MTNYPTLRKLVSNKGPVEIRDQSFPQQDAFVIDPSRFIDACCTRRAGKSNGLGLRFARTMTKYPGCMVPYTALTRDSAKNIMWPVLQEQNEKFKWQAKFTESNLTMTFPNESRCQLFGADMKNFIRRLKGPKYPGVGIDEAQDFGSHLQSLVDDVFTPAISDFEDGWLALTGTPGPIPYGYFYEVTELRQHGYSHHAWSLYDNPYLPNARAFVEALKIQKKWPEDNPTLMREWKGKWVLDLDALIFKYKPTENHYDEVPKGKMQYVMGVDLGHDDADAIAVIGWTANSDTCYLVEEFIKNKQGITPLVGQIQERIDKYDPQAIVVDTGGLGKKIVVEIQDRFKLPLQAAEKDRKFEFIELMNDAFRMQKFYAKKNSKFADDCARVKKDMDSVKLKISDTFHSDICFATLYAFREAMHWLYEAPPAEGPRKGTPEYARKQELELEQRIDEAYKNSKGENMESLESNFFDANWKEFQ